LVYGTIVAYGYCTACTVKHFGSSLASMPLFGRTAYIGFTAFLLNVVVAVLLTLILRAAKVSNGRDITRRADYFVDADSPGLVQPDVVDPIRP
jgi:SSS family solute:Na+ symporter